MFWLTVVVPVAIATLYFGFLASDVYTSEARFIVRSPAKPTVSSLGAILSGGGIAGAGEEAHAVVDYVRSRSALADVNRDGFVTRAYSAPGVSIFDRYGGWLGRRNEEALYRYFSDSVSIDLDSASQITTLTVHAFSPEAAHDINERLLESSERLVNRLSERGRRDTLARAQAEVEAARLKARNAVVSLARYRDQSGVIDPEKQAAINLQMISKLQDALIAERAQLAQFQAYTPQNPQIPGSRLRVRMIEQEIARLGRNVAGAPRSLSAAASRFQELQFDAEFASKQLAAAQTSLEEARQDAERKQAYVERVAQPNQPDYPLGPKRLRNILATLVLGLIAWGVLTTLLAGVREHRD